jgi:hypothetical protein
MKNFLVLVFVLVIAWFLGWHFYSLNQDKHEFLLEVRSLSSLPIEKIQLENMVVQNGHTENYDFSVKETRNPYDQTTTVVFTHNKRFFGEEKMLPQEFFCEILPKMKETQKQNPK